MLPPAHNRKGAASGAAAAAFSAVAMLRAYAPEHSARPAAVAERIRALSMGALVELTPIVAHNGADSDPYCGITAALFCFAALVFYNDGKLRRCLSQLLWRGFSDHCAHVFEQHCDGLQLTFSERLSNGCQA